MALTKISTEGVKDDAITKAKIPADQIEASELANDAVDTNAIQDDAVTEDKLANSINTAIAANTAKDLTNLDASNLSTGTVPDARISATSVQQHATSFDDNKIINDISALALKLNALQNATKYNTNSTSVDTFQDSNGITNLTNVIRDVNEYISSRSTSISSTSVDIDSTSEFSTYFTMNDTAWVNYNSNDGSNNRTFAKTTNYTGTNTNLQRFFSDSDVWNNTNTNANNWVIGFDFGENRDISPTSINFTHRVGYGNLLNPGGIKVWGSNDLSTITDFGSGVYHQSNPYVNAGNNSISTSNYFRYVGLSYQYVGGTNYPQLNDGEIVGTLRTSSTSISATGSFESNAITASASTTKMGVVITYIDQAGTATLNTDLKLYVSADNGSNYTQVTLVAQPDFATGVKMAKANDVTVTAGTQLKYKVEFANQSASKETRVTGVSLQY